MSAKINKNGLIMSPYQTISNLYLGTQANCSKGSWQYNIESEVFKDYGFSTCHKWNSPGTTTASMGYSYILPVKTYSAGEEFVVSMYTYISNDCNARMCIRMEHDGFFTDTNISCDGGLNKANNNIHHSTKGEVVFVWGKFKLGSDGKVYIMFYPAIGSSSTAFSTGYQMFAGITIYKGSDLLLPMNNGVSGSGFVEIENQNKQLKINKNYITAKDFIEL